MFRQRLRAHRSAGRRVGSKQDGAEHQIGRRELRTFLTFWMWIGAEQDAGAAAQQDTSPATRRRRRLGAARDAFCSPTTHVLALRYLSHAPDMKKRASREDGDVSWRASEVSVRGEGHATGRSKVATYFACTRVQYTFYQIVVTFGRIVYRALGWGRGAGAGAHRFQGGGRASPRPTPPLACGEASGGGRTPPLACGGHPPSSSWARNSHQRSDFGPQSCEIVAESPLSWRI